LRERQKQEGKKKEKVIIIRPALVVVRTSLINCLNIKKGKKQKRSSNKLFIKIKVLTRKEEKKR
jgi:hypothetical protein